MNRRLATALILVTSGALLFWCLHPGPRADLVGCGPIQNESASQPAAPASNPTTQLVRETVTQTPEAHSLPVFAAERELGWLRGEVIDAGVDPAAIEVVPTFGRMPYEGLLRDDRGGSANGGSGSDRT